MKSLLPLLILIYCHKIQGVLEWMVIEKVTDYGQNVTLFCNVSNCCPKYAGWDMWTPKQRTLFIDLKTGRTNKKYGGRISKDGYTLIIQKLNKQDLNVSYSCVYGATLGERKILLEEDVFIYISSTHPNDSTGNRIFYKDEIAALITGVILLVLVTIFVTICIWRRKTAINRKRNKGTDEEYESLIEMEEINTEQGEVIPRNIREIMRKQIKDWEKKDKMFVSTRASKYVNQCLQNESCVTLTAPAGVGKSFICRHAALFLQKNGYKIIPVYAPTDIRDYYQPGRQTVFVVDDICGNFIASQQQIEKWKQMIPVINTIMSDTCCRIIVSCRLQVYLDDKFKILSPFKSFECNLISDKLCLTFDEKTNIAKSYIGTSVKNIDLSQSNDFFPLLCSLYHEKNNLDIKEFFKNPFVVYKNELDKLSEYGDEGNYKICGLALCVIFNNQLGEKWFQDRLTNEQRHIIKNVCNACEISRSTPKSKLKKALETLNGTFIRKQNGMYKTVHDKMFDFLAHYFGEKMIYCLIDNSNSDLIHERFVWKKSPDEKSSNIDFIIEIPDDYLESYLKRLDNDWSAGNVLSVFDNANMEMSLFRQQLLQYLKKLDKEKQNALVNTSDTVVPIGNWGSGTTPLIISCFYGYTDMVQWILHYTVDVDKCSNSKANGLVYASEQGHTDVVKLLLEMNPNVDSCCYYGITPLIQASQYGHTDVVRLLLQKDPKVDQCDFIGCSALLEASHNGHIDIVKLLLEKKAECNICSHSKQSMIYTISNHPTETLDEYKRYMFERLVQNNSPNVTDYVRRKPIDPFDVLGGSSPLHIACFMGRIDVVRCLLDHNANINITKEDGTTPLFYACEVGHDDLVHLLLDKAADTELCRFDDKSPLNIATENRHDSIVKILTERKRKGVHSLNNLFVCSGVHTPIASHL